MGIDECRLINLPKIADPRGNLTFVESERHVPFNIRRVYYVNDVPGGSERGGHAHKACKEFIIAMSGSFNVILNDGNAKHRFHVNRSFYGLYVSSMVWHKLDNFSSGSVCLVLASEYFDESDYYRDYQEFLKVLKDAPR